MPLQKLNRNSIETGGFHGIQQKRLIVHPKYGPGMGVRLGTWPGIGNLIYLADSWFGTGIATGMHPHKFIDVLTFVVEGELSHEGSLEHGVNLKALDFQVQKSGKEGFAHNEVNKGTLTTRMLQLWLIPEKEEATASFRVRVAEKGKITKVYGNEDGNSTQIEVGHLLHEQSYVSPKNSLIYVASGAIEVEGELIGEGVLFEANRSKIVSLKDSIFIIAYNVT
ncbi:pirin family protein [Aquimarina agarilytica]|uniref:pirin family protein n=1 Tax=Aquimarina agarilytica TaxID=1087449 RepID=UPI00028A0A0E|nr:pirin family protein [Aquimarina agarilytica]